MKCNISGGLPVNSTASARRIEPNAAFTAAGSKLSSRGAAPPAFAFHRWAAVSDDLERPLPDRFRRLAATLDLSTRKA